MTRVVSMVMLIVTAFAARSLLRRSQRQRGRLLHASQINSIGGRVAMAEIKTEFPFTIAFEVQVFDLGDTPYGSRRIARLGTGSFEGPKLKGTVLLGGGGWSLMRRDDVLEIGGHGLALETDDKQHIYMTWKGFRHGPKEVIDRLNRGETVDPETYYFRTTPYFETSSEKYGWMNRICSIASGSRTASGRTFQVFQVL